MRLPKDEIATCGLARLLLQGAVISDEQIRHCTPIVLKKKQLHKPIAGEVLVLVFLAPPKRTQLCVLFMAFFLNRCALWFRALMVSGCACRGGRAAALLRNVSRAVQTSRRHQRTSGPTSGATIAIILYKYICLQENVTVSRCSEDVFISSLSLCQAV